MSQINYRITTIDDVRADLICESCGHAVHTTRADCKAWLMRKADPTTNPCRDNCPECGDAYVDWTPTSPVTALNNEFTRFGTTVAEVMTHYGKEDAVGLGANIGFILLDKEERFGLKAFTAQERFVYAAQAMLREVNNGGFDQFFLNSSGRLSHDLVPGLEALGSQQFLPIARAAVDRFGADTKLSDSSREKRLRSLDRQTNFSWDDLEGQFYQCEEPLESLIIEFIRTNGPSFA